MLTSRAASQRRVQFCGLLPPLLRHADATLCEAQCTIHEHMLCANAHGMCSRTQSSDLTHALRLPPPSACLQEAWQDSCAGCDAELSEQGLRLAQNCTTSWRAAAQVLAGPPTQLLMASPPRCERLTVTNGSEAKSRLLLSGAALQLADEHGNPSPAAGRSARISLRWPTDDDGRHCCQGHAACCACAVGTVLVSSHCGFPECPLPQMHTCPECCSISFQCGMNLQRPFARIKARHAENHAI